MLAKARKQPLSALGRILPWMRRRESWLVAGSIGAAVLLAWLLYEPVAMLLAKAFDARAWILSFGSLAPLVYILLFSTQILVAPLPGNFLGVIGGYLFGVLLGSLYSIIGLMIGAGLAMFIGRRFGRPMLERFFTPADLKLWEKKLRMRSPLTWTLLFVFPVPDLVFYMAGLSSLPLRTLLLAVAIGRGLGLIFANAVGYWSLHLPPEWVAVKWGVIAILGVLVYTNQRRIRLSALRMTRRSQRWIRQRKRNGLQQEQRQTLGASDKNE
jgi:uncharacterized membrane protein YdjX (TVP38/TMEM64 family)